MPAAVETAFFGANKPAWHGLGTVIEDDVVTAAEALDLSGLDWHVVKENIYDAIGEPIKGHYAITRTSDMSTLGIVGERYKPVQNRQAFQFCDALFNTGEAKFHTAGSLFDGRKVWMLMKLDHTLKLHGMDSEVIDEYVLFSNTHDGSGAITLATTPVRVVCNNTLTLALNQSPRVYKVRHTQNLGSRLADAQRALGLAYQYIADLGTKGEQMIDTPMEEGSWYDLKDHLFPLPSPENKRGTTIALNTRGELDEIYFGADNLKPIHGTKWGALQAIIEYENHRLGTRKTATDPAHRRMERITNPLKSNLSNRAMEFLNA